MLTVRYKDFTKGHDRIYMNNQPYKNNSKAFAGEPSRPNKMNSLSAAYEYVMYNETRFY
jgi:hypothetical protein